eukprot:TRINITY_DN2_c0_g1_i5.p1 TRINITY_DN2_c0_g1~~TRINITY_DN2_c0_g1_i5.p1  ORF type:complete len:71 (-),score=21.02 TRINITY_DN2_c0_g1_i5:158-370(-)
MFSRYCQKVMADVQAGAKQEEADLEAEVNREQQAVMKKVNAALVEINAIMTKGQGAAKKGLDVFQATAKK